MKKGGISLNRTEGLECIELLKKIEESQDSDVRKIGERFYFSIQKYHQTIDIGASRKEVKKELQEIRKWKQLLEKLFS